MQDSLYAAGDTGFLHRRAAADGTLGPYTWSGFDGTERTLDSYGAALPGQYGYYGAGTDTLLTSPATSGVAQVRDMSTGATSEVAVPDGQYVLGSFGSTLITEELDEYWQIVRLHVLHLTPAGAIAADIPVDAPESHFFHQQPLMAGDAASVVIRFRHANDIGLLDLATGRVALITTHALLDEAVDLQAALSPTRIALYETDYPADHALVVRRDDPTGAQTPVPVVQSDAGTPFVGLSGDWLLTTYVPPYYAQPGPSGPLTATPIEGGTVRTLLPVAGPQIVQIPSGDAIVTGPTSEGGWTAQRVTVGPSGKPVLDTP